MTNNSISEVLPHDKIKSKCPTQSFTLPACVNLVPHLDKNVKLDPHFSESLSNKSHGPKFVKRKDQIDTKYLISGTNLILRV